MRAERALVAAPPPRAVGQPRAGGPGPTPPDGQPSGAGSSSQDHQPGVARWRRAAQRGGERCGVRRRRTTPSRPAARAAPRGRGGARRGRARPRPSQFDRQATKGDVELDVLGLELVGRHRHAGLAGDERREEHGVLGPVVVVEHGREEAGPASCPARSPASRSRSTWAASARRPRWTPTNPTTARGRSIWNMALTMRSAGCGRHGPGMGFRMRTIPEHVCDARQTRPMAFGQQAGPPATHRQLQELLGLLQETGYEGFREPARPARPHPAPGRREVHPRRGRHADRPAPGRPPSRAATWHPPHHRRSCRPPSRSCGRCPPSCSPPSCQRRGWAVMEP